MSINNKKVIRDGKVAVLISPGFGAGWYTWHQQKRLVFAPEIVKMVEQRKASEIDKDWIEENLGIKDVYCGGAPDLTICWLPINTHFKIEEYNGSESIRTLEDLTLIA